MGVLGVPSPGNVTKAFGVGGHKGTDRGHGNGLAVYAMADGTVSGIRDFADYGLTVTVDHGYLIAGKHTQTRYRHLSAESVNLGLQVGRGTRIATQGSDGYLTDEVHLHTELLLDGVVVDEQKYQTGAVPAGTEGNTIMALDAADKAWLNGLGQSIIDQLKAHITVEANRVIASGGSGGGYNPTDPDVVDEAELGASLTSTVSLINAHADINRDQILAKVNGLTLTHN